MSAATTSPTLIVATRKSALALAQCRAWMRTLELSTGVRLEELHVTTTGDRIVDRPLNAIGGKGLFIKEIETALLDTSAHLAVHSMKDVPSELAPGLRLACIPPREDPRDCVRTRSGAPLAELPSGAKVGTSSLRRIIQLRKARPDLQFVPLRGNVDTRLQRCREGVVDAVVLATAGLKRLGLQSEITEILSPEVCLPAIGQGALAVETRSSDESTWQVVRRLNDPETEYATAAERGVLLAAEGNCQVPIAGYATRDSQGRLWLRALLAEADGSDLRTREAVAPWPSSSEEAHQLGFELGLSLKR